MQLSVIIVNYNVKFFLEHCLLSVIKAIRNIDAEIFVVDNGSSDGSDVFFQNKFKMVNFIWNENNVGFAKACNQALGLASGDYILFLNPDTLIPEDCFEKCISFIKTKNNDCALGIKMIDGSGRFLKESKRAFPAPMIAFYKLTGLARMFPQSKIFSKYHLGHLSQNANHEVEVLAGAFMMVPKKILDVTGGFDEDFFMYGEDIDLSFRIQKAGFRNFYFAESSLIHFKGESTRKGSFSYVKMFYKAMSIFVKKHEGHGRAGVFNLFIQSAIFSRAVLAALARSVKMIGLPAIDKQAIGAKQTIVCATEAEYGLIIHFIEKANNRRQIIGRIETGDDRNLSNCLGSFADLRQILLRHSSFNEIIFCEGALSFKQIITAITEVPVKAPIKFFAKDAHAIIGSDDKGISVKYIPEDEKEILFPEGVYDIAKNSLNV